MLAVAAVMAAAGCGPKEETTPAPSPGAGAVSGRPAPGAGGAPGTATNPNDPNAALNNPNVPDYAKNQIKSYQQGQGGGGGMPGGAAPVSR